MFSFLRVASCFAVFFCFQSFAAHRVLAVGNDKLLVVAQDGKVTWEMPLKGGTHDLHVLPNGNYLAIRDAKVVVEIDPKTKSEVWQYNAAEKYEKPIEIHAVQPLPNGNVMIAESGPSRIIEVDRSGKVVAEIPFKLAQPDPHRDTRLARKLSNGNYLVAHEGEGVIREYNKSAEVVWEFAVPTFGKDPKPGHGPEAFGNQSFSAIRLENGNTLVGTGNGHSILEVTPKKRIVWELHQNDLPDITLAWITTLEVLPNGNFVIGNCHAGPGQPQIVEVEPKSKNVVWKFEQFELLGNDLTNSVLLD